MRGVWPPVSEAKTEIMCLRAKGVPESTATFSVEAAGQVYNQTNACLYLGGNVNHNDDLSIEVDRRIRNAPKYIISPPPENAGCFKVFSTFLPKIGRGATTK